MPLDTKSPYLTTTFWGQFKYLVLPFGFNNAAEEFQMAMEDKFKDISEVNLYFDDLALGTDSFVNHCQLLHKVLTRDRETNLRPTCRNLL